MKLKNILFIVLMVCLTISAVSAQTLPVDTRKIPMQFSKTFSTARYTLSADTLYNKITLPSNCVEVVILAETGSVQVCPDSTYITTSAYPKNYATITAGLPMKLPTYKGTKFYVRRAASGTASVVNLIFYKM